MTKQIRSKQKQRDMKRYRSQQSSEKARRTGYTTSAFSNQVNIYGDGGNGGICLHRRYQREKRDPDREPSENLKCQNSRKEEGEKSMEEDSQEGEDERKIIQENAPPDALPSRA